MGGPSNRRRASRRWSWLSYALPILTTALAFYLVRGESETRRADSLSVSLAAPAPAAPVHTVSTNVRPSEPAPANSGHRAAPGANAPGPGFIPMPVAPSPPRAGNSQSDQLPAPVVSEEEEEDREYVRDRRDLMFEELEAAWLGEPEERARSEEVRREVVEELREFGPVGEVAADCRTTLCKITVPVTSSEMARQAELLLTPQHTDQVVKIVNDATRGVIERVELYRLPKGRLEQLIGDHPEEALRPGTLGATTATAEPVRGPAGDDEEALP